MSARARSTRKAAQAVSYVQEKPEEGEEWISSEDEGGTSKRKKPAPKRRKVEVEESDDATSDEEEDEEGEEEVPANLDGVDWTKLLPVELTLEIFTYLHSASLFALAMSNKSLHSLLADDKSKKLWLTALSVDKLPMLGENEISPIRLSSYLFSNGCQYCKDGIVEHADRFLLLRLCPSCRKANLVPITEVGPGAKYPDFHPATVPCTVTTQLPPHDARYARTAAYANWGDLQAVNETLEALQLEDDASADTPFNEDGPDVKKVQKTLARARKVGRRSWGETKAKRVSAIEETLDGEWGPNVKKFVQERRALKEDRRKIAEWLYQHEKRLGDEKKSEGAEAASADRQAKQARREALEDRVAAEGAFNRKFFNRYEWRSHPLVSSTAVVTDESFKNIKKPLISLLARLTAEDVVSRLKRRDELSDDEYGRPHAPKKPKSVTAAAWKLALPEVRKLLRGRPVEPAVKPRKGRDMSDDSDDDEEPEQEKEVAVRWFPWPVTSSKIDFFKARLLKIRQMQPTKAAGAYIPSLDAFKALPAVKLLWNDDKFAASSDTNDDDLVKWGEHFDSILEEVNSYALDLRLQAIKLVLAATTEMEDDEIEAELDDDALADPRYDDDFFLRPSSWVCCAKCGEPDDLVSILLHSERCHNYVRRSRGDSSTAPFDLPLEVAVGLSAVFELAGIDADDSKVTRKDVDDALVGKSLSYSNAPKYKIAKKIGWRQLIEKLHRLAHDYDRRDEPLPAPVITLSKNKPRRQRWRRFGYYDGW